MRIITGLLSSSSACKRSFEKSQGHVVLPHLLKMLDSTWSFEVFDVLLDLVTYKTFPFRHDYLQIPPSPFDASPVTEMDLFVSCSPLATKTRSKKGLQRVLGHVTAVKAFRNEAYLLMFLDILHFSPMELKAKV